MTPAAPAVRDTLERILASETFARSERARRLLRYLVEQQLDGNTDRLKGLSIAVEVLGRQAGFDGSTDAVVRVQAGRLRDLLDEYFAGEGAVEPIRITVPRGGYVPVYEQAPAGAAVPGPPQDPLPGADPAPNPSRQGKRPAAYPARLMRHVHFLWAAMALIIVMLGVLVYRLQPPGMIAQGEAAMVAGTGAGEATAATEALPAVHIAMRTEDAASARVAAVLRMALSGFDTIDFIAGDPSAAGMSGDALHFIFQIAAGPSDGSVLVELRNAGSGKVLMSRLLNPADLAGPGLTDRIADIATASAPASGAIYAFIEQNRLQSGLVACTLLNDHYYLDRQQATHEAAYRCLDKLVAAGTKSPLAYAELASLQMVAVTEQYAFPENASGEQALALASLAVRIGVTSPYAHRAYGFITARLGNRQESIRWMRKAHELNIYDLGMAASYGNALIFTGDYRRGTDIIERAAEAATIHPNWWDYSMFLGQFMLGEMDEAARSSEALMRSNRSNYLAARIVAASAGGHKPDVERLLGELSAAFPQFAADPASFFRHANYPADLTDRLVGALQAAGLDRAS